MYRHLRVLLTVQPPSISGLKAHLAARGMHISPQQYVLKQLTSWITAARSRGAHIITGGDFNMDPTTSRGITLHHWAQDFALHNVFSPHMLDTAPKMHLLGGIPHSRIDHIYDDNTIVSRGQYLRSLPRYHLVMWSSLL